MILLVLSVCVVLQELYGVFCDVVGSVDIDLECLSCQDLAALLRTWLGQGSHRKVGGRWEEGRREVGGR